MAPLTPTYSEKLDPVSGPGSVGPAENHPWPPPERARHPADFLRQRWACINKEFVREVDKLIFHSYQYSIWIR